MYVFFAIGSFDKVVTKLMDDLMNTTKLLDSIEYQMKEHKDDNIWLGFRVPWQSQQDQKEKFQLLVGKLLSYAIRSLFKLHEYNILHLDIKGY